MPNQTGTYFGNTITFLCQHSADGALGVMINRPTQLTVSTLLDTLAIAIDPAAAERLGAEAVLEGGPVSPEQGFILHTAEVGYDATLQLGEGLALTTTPPVLEAIGAGRGPERYLVAIGYAGWGPGQLEQELAQNAWLTCPCNHEILFDTPMDERVDTAARQLGFDFRLISPHTGHA